MNDSIELLILLIMLIVAFCLGGAVGGNAGKSAVHKEWCIEAFQNAPTGADSLAVLLDKPFCKLDQKEK